MSKLPKLIVQPPFTYGGENYICNLEEAKYRFDFNPLLIVAVEMQVVNSYEELVQLANQEHYRDKEFLKVMILQHIEGG